MIKAYVLATVEGDDSGIVEEVSKLDEVKEIRSAFGNYDIVIELEGEDEKQLGNLILEKIRTIEKITSTITVLTTSLYKK